jgi:manganese efflux pump family protein
LIAFSLSFDSFAVSVCSGLSMCRKHLKFTQALKIAAVLAIFQGLMPVLGWFIGETFNAEIQQADHWIAFGLLLFLGIKMIREGRIPVNQRKIKDPLRWRVLFTISLATSIDAFAMGIGFSFFTDNIVLPALLIGLVTFGVSFAGIYMGRKLGSKMAGVAEISGGIILILIGLKILLEHLYFA